MLFMLLLPLLLKRRRSRRKMKSYMDLSSPTLICLINSWIRSEKNWTFATILMVKLIPLPPSLKLIYTLKLTKSFMTSKTTSGWEIQCNFKSPKLVIRSQWSSFKIPKCLPISNASKRLSATVMMNPRIDYARNLRTLFTSS